MVSPISSRTYGVIPGGATNEARRVEAWTLTGNGGLVLETITYGGIVTRLLAPGFDGKIDDVVLGLSDLDSYLAGNPYFGAIIGRVAGRITDAAFTIDGKTYQLARNEAPNHVHGGVCGFDKRVWGATPLERADGAPSLRLAYRSPDGEEGYPGNIEVSVTYTVTNDNVFLIETEATADRTTPLCLTNHSLFNLAGEASGSIADHRLEIFASKYVPAGEDLTLTGRLELVAGQGNDFHMARRLGDVIPELFRNHGDLYMLPKHPAHELALAARLEELTSGRVMTVSTTENYLQLYTGSRLSGTCSGKSGVAYGPYAGLCLECQGYADAANAALRKDILLRPGERQRHATAYAFSISSAGTTISRSRQNADCASIGGTRQL